MARDHARVYSAIWSDPDFVKLPSEPQLTFLKVLSQPKVSLCGALDLTPKRLALLTSDATERSIRRSISVLKDARFLVTDENTEEMLIRSFVRYDGLLTSPNVTKGMAKDYLTVLSDLLRATVEHELARAYDEGPDLAGWKALTNSYPDLMAKVSGKGSRKGSTKGLPNAS